ncbi:hypothetical protein [Micromonospora sp. CB01531]|uniref:hypothetical protein n=1 Tax=Micromonospora sp. CB01531 TaxID=1718947 RepID=UPI0011612D03|nr:hypothetical protein [Micromonospora sp. CB01531]
MIRWEDPPPQQRGGRRPSGFPAELVARDLREHPGRWALVDESPNRLNLASHIRGGMYPAFRPAGSFEAVTRTDGTLVRTYARFVGTAD